MLLFFLVAACRGYVPAFETLLFDVILWHDEFVVVEACLIFGGRHIIVVLDLPVRSSLMRADSFVLLAESCWSRLSSALSGVLLSTVPDSPFLLWRDLERRR